MIEGGFSTIIYIKKWVFQLIQHVGCAWVRQNTQLLKFNDGDNKLKSPISTYVPKYSSYFQSCPTKPLSYQLINNLTVLFPPIQGSKFGNQNYLISIQITVKNLMINSKILQCVSYSYHDDENIEKYQLLILTKMTMAYKNNYSIIRKQMLGTLLCILIS